MADVEIVLNTGAVGAILKSQEMQAVLEEQARKIAGRAGGPDDYEVYVAGTRAVVSTRTEAGYRDNLEHNTLLKGMGG